MTINNIDSNFTRFYPGQNTAGSILQEQDSQREEILPDSAYTPNISSKKRALHAVFEESSPLKKRNTSNLSERIPITPDECRVMRYLFLNSGLKQKTFATLTGKSVSFISKLANGKRVNILESEGKRVNEIFGKRIFENAPMPDDFSYERGIHLTIDPLMRNAVLKAVKDCPGLDITTLTFIIGGGEIDQPVYDWLLQKGDFRAISKYSLKRINQFFCDEIIKQVDILQKPNRLSKGGDNKKRINVTTEECKALKIYITAVNFGQQTLAELTYLSRDIIKQLVKKERSPKSVLEIGGQRINAVFGVSVFSNAPQPDLFSHDLGISMVISSRDRDAVLEAIGNYHGFFLGPQGVNLDLLAIDCVAHQSIYNWLKGDTQTISRYSARRINQILDDNIIHFDEQPIRDLTATTPEPWDTLHNHPVSEWEPPSFEQEQSIGKEQQPENSDFTLFDEDDCVSLFDLNSSTWKEPCDLSSQSPPVVAKKEQEPLNLPPWDDEFDQLFR